MCLLEHNRDRYQLDPVHGSGCRYWCSRVLQDFVESGWLVDTSDAVNQLAETIKVVDPLLRSLFLPHRARSTSDYLYVQDDRERPCICVTIIDLYIYD